MPHGVVVVDDAEDLRTLIVMALDRDERLQVLADVGDGRQGIDAVAQHRPDVVLMDISMPVMDGVTATRELKQKYPDLPIVVLTGYADERLAAEARTAGADAFLEKTTPLAEVAQTLVDVAAAARP